MIWECVDDVLRHLYTSPPAPEAEMRVEFHYRA